MHSGMPCDPIQGQSHESLEVRQSYIFKVYLRCHLKMELANDC